MMPQDKTDNRERVPIIKLKLKVGNKKKSDVVEGQVAGFEGGESGNFVVDSSNTEINTTNNEINTANINNIANVTDNTNNNITITNNKISTSQKQKQNDFHVTFKYRPFKLFPLLPVSTRYRVLIPAQYTLPRSNRAIPLSYLWSGGGDGVYTDDSDLFCVALREKWFNKDEVVGKRILIEVEVVNRKEDHNEDCKKDHNEGCNKDHNNDYTNNHFGNPLDNQFPVRFTKYHDGNYIKVIKCTIDPSDDQIKKK